MWRRSWNVPPSAVRIKELDFAERPVVFLLANGQALRARCTASRRLCGAELPVQVPQVRLDGVRR